MKIRYVYYVLFTCIFFINTISAGMDDEAGPSDGERRGRFQGFQQIQSKMDQLEKLMLAAHLPSHVYEELTSMRHKEKGPVGDEDEVMDDMYERVEKVLRNVEMLAPQQSEILTILKSLQQQVEPSVPDDHHIEAWKNITGLIHNGTLDLRNRNITDEIVTIIAPQLPPTLRRLLLNGNYIGRQGIEVLCANMPRDVEVLALNHNVLDQGSVNMLASRLRLHCHNLHTLDLSYNQIGIRGAAAITLSLPQLKALDVSHTFNFPGLIGGKAGYISFFDGLKYMRGLKVLRMGHLNINDRNAAEVCTYLREVAERLDGIDLQGNPLEDAWALHFVKLLVDPNHIRELGLSGMGLSAHGAIALLPHLGSVEELDLSVNHLGELGAVSFAEALQKSGIHLKRLKLHKNGLKPGGQGSTALMQKYGSLEYLSLADQDQNAIADVKAALHQQSFKTVFDALGVTDANYLKLLIKQNNWDINQENAQGVTPLMGAVDRGNHVAMITLLELGADPNHVSTTASKGYNGYNEQNRGKGGQYNGIKIEYYFGAPGDATLLYPLAKAIMRGDQQAVSVLLGDKRTNVNLFRLNDKKGGPRIKVMLPLDIALREKNIYMVRQLVQKGASTKGYPAGYSHLIYPHKARGPAVGLKPNQYAFYICAFPEAATFLAHS